MIRGKTKNKLGKAGGKDKAPFGGATPAGTPSKGKTARGAGENGRRG
jgi:hypothetical protein